MCRAAQGGGGAAWDAARAVLCQLSARRFSARSCSQEAFRKKRIGMKKMLPIRYLPKKKKKMPGARIGDPCRNRVKKSSCGEKKKKAKPLRNAAAPPAGSTAPASTCGRLPPPRAQPPPRVAAAPFPPAAPPAAAALGRKPLAASPSALSHWRCGLGLFISACCCTAAA